ncbi:TPA: hypothetical protein DCZ90_03230 [Candidatus Amesbacteria bacterium]|nr:hypothetical protein [Candidatus Amesbacteria bacterium]
MLNTPTPVVLGDSDIALRADEPVTGANDSSSNLGGWLLIGAGIVALVTSGLLLVFRKASPPSVL